jgi:hypothetical protein
MLSDCDPGAGGIRRRDEQRAKEPKPARDRSRESYPPRSQAIREEFEQGADDITQVHRDKKPCLIIPVGSVLADLM